MELLNNFLHSQSSYYLYHRCYEWGLHADFKDTSSPEYVPLYANSFPSLTGKLNFIIGERIIMLVFIRNRLIISGGLESVFSHTKKLCLSIVLYPVFYEYKNKLS